MDNAKSLGPVDSLLYNLKDFSCLSNKLVMQLHSNGNNKSKFVINCFPTRYSHKGIT